MDTFYGLIKQLTIERVYISRTSLNIINGGRIITTDAALISLLNNKGTKSSGHAYAAGCSAALAKQSSINDNVKQACSFVSRIFAHFFLII